MILVHGWPPPCHPFVPSAKEGVGHQGPILVHASRLISADVRADVAAAVVSQVAGISPRLGVPLATHGGGSHSLLPALQTCSSRDVRRQVAVLRRSCANAVGRAAVVLLAAGGRADTPIIEVPHVNAQSVDQFGVVGDGQRGEVGEGRNPSVGKSLPRVAVAIISTKRSRFAGSAMASNEEVVVASLGDVISLKLHSSGFRPVATTVPRSARAASGPPPGAEHHRFRTPQLRPRGRFGGTVHLHGRSARRAARPLPTAL